MNNSQDTKNSQPEQEPATKEQIREAMIFNLPLYTTPPQPKEPKQEPIAYFNPQVKGGFYWAKPTKITAPITVSVEPMPLYTSPPQPKEPEQPAQQEPVAWIHNFIDGGISIGKRPADLNRHPDRWTALYKEPKPCPTCEALARTVMLDQTSHDTTPPQRKPLTDKQYIEIGQRHWLPSIKVEQIHKEIEEAAHNIKE